MDNVHYLCRGHKEAKGKILLWAVGRSALPAAGRCILHAGSVFPFTCRPSRGWNLMALCVILHSVLLLITDWPPLVLPDSLSSHLRTPLPSPPPEHPPTLFPHLDIPFCSHSFSDAWLVIIADPSHFICASLQSIKKKKGGGGGGRGRGYKSFKP